MIIKNMRPNKMKTYEIRVTDLDDDNDMVTFEIQCSDDTDTAQNVLDTLHKTIIEQVEKI